MENLNAAANNHQLVAEVYGKYTPMIEAFISQRVSSSGDVENLTQDVWVKVLTYSQPLNAETLQAFIFTIARNIVNDFLRHHYIATGVHAELKNNATDVCEDMESAVIANDLADIERRRVENLPAQRRVIYYMTRYEDKAVDEIAQELNLSSRTVENHLRLGRRDIRAYIDAIA